MKNDEESLKAFTLIAHEYTKEELVQKALESFQITAHLVDLLRVLSVNRNELSPVQQTMYDSASASRLRENSRKAAKVIVAQYDENVKGASIEEVEAE